MARARASLRRWHTWLGWLVGIPILLWTVSGLVMVWKPIEEVRGTDLLRSPDPIQLQGPVVPPAVAGAKIEALSLEPRASGPRWVIAFADGTTRLADPATGALLPPLSARDAAEEVRARYTGTAALRSVARVDTGKPPIEYRRDTPAWKVAMDDGTNFYVDARSGEVLARRTSWWRFYDLMWGLHIMDLETREDTHNPLVVGFGIASLVMALLALVLLPMTLRFRRRRRIRSDPTATP